MTKNSPLLSIIIVSYNTSKITVSCIKSILQDRQLKNGDHPFEIIVVDNNSKDDSVQKIKDLKLKNLKIITNHDNKGFGAANNQGLKIAKGEYVLLLNSDTLIKNSSISQCLIWLSSHPEAASCTSMLLNPDGTIQATGGFFPNKLNYYAWRLHLDDLPFFNNFVKPIHPHTPSFYTKDKFYTTDQKLDWLTGAFILTRKNILDKVNGFDEDYFMYAEDLEIFYRVKKAFPHLHQQYLSGPQTVHIGGASASNKGTRYKLELEGIAKFFQKHKI